MRVDIVPHSDATCNARVCDRCPEYTHMHVTYPLDGSYKNFSTLNFCERHWKEWESMHALDKLVVG